MRVEDVGERAAALEGNATKYFSSGLRCEAGRVATLAKEATRQACEALQLRERRSGRWPRKASPFWWQSPCEWDRGGASEWHHAWCVPRLGAPVRPGERWFWLQLGRAARVEKEIRDVWCSEASGTAKGSRHAGCTAYGGGWDKVRGGPQSGLKVTANPLVRAELPITKPTSMSWLP
ncbi:hypothetical protein ERJ75_001053100 [Trypanosoma vivax]|nr:hypothetical protein ERJ75_001053100 [Trypanosoma vivax]